MKEDESDDDLDNNDTLDQESELSTFCTDRCKGEGGTSDGVIPAVSSTCEGAVAVPAAESSNGSCPISPVW